MKNVIAYVRVSTIGQTGEDRFGLDAQRDQITTYCADNDMNIVRWVSEEGVSGAAEERPGFDSIVFGDDTEGIDAVVVAKFDRVARDVTKYFTYKHMLKKKDVALVSVSEDFGAAGNFAPMLESLVVCIAEMERQTISKRTSGGRKIKAAKGGYSGGRAPMGYKVQNGKLVINEDEAPVVRFIFAHKRMHDTMINTMRSLNAEGYKTRSGKEFQISTVQSIWNNEKTYLGWYHYGETDEWVKGQHDPIIEKAIEEEI